MPHARSEERLKGENDSGNDLNACDGEAFVDASRLVITAGSDCPAELAGPQRGRRRELPP
jgi:hypothetical protein